MKLTGHFPSLLSPIQLSFLSDRIFYAEKFAEEKLLKKLRRVVNARAFRELLYELFQIALNISCESLSKHENFNEMFFFLFAHGAA